jgi:DNA-binding FadR family transcriptional regulator
MPVATAGSPGPGGTAADGPGGMAPGPDEGKLAARVARRIEADVVARGWPVGASLGSEPELRARHGVSRAVLREAVRLVEHHQVARMRRGPGGGLFVVSPDAGPAARALVIYLQYAGTGVEDLMEARRLLEPLSARLAAERIGEDGVALVRRTLAEEAAETAPGRPERLHVVLAELSGNHVLGLFVDVLVRLTGRYARPVDLSRRRFQVARAESLRFHGDIGAAVIAGDPGGAEAAMGAYLDGVLTWLRNHARVRAAPPGPAGDGVPGKMAEVVAGRLRDDIAAGGWQVGAVVGSEAGLLTRYGVSRAVLREAVRLLEYHSVARMRRGPGGGLVVGAPDPTASVETMALYLEHAGVSAEDLLPVREALELGALGRVAAGHDGAVRDRLEAAVRWATDGPPDDPGTADAFHTELAELSGNPALALFLRILTGLWRRHTATDEATVGPEARAEVARVHRRIAEALLAGDEGLARHRLRRHLAALPAWWHSAP